MVGILFVGQMEYAPFVKNYIQSLEKNGESYEFVQWNRSGASAQGNREGITFSTEISRYDNLIKKVMPYLKFRKFLKKTIKERKYDKLIVLTTQTALMIPEVLLGRYKGKYFFDYRDTSYENLKPYKMLIDAIIKKSYATCISSPGFKEYLTNEKELLIAHNYQKENLGNRVLEYGKSENDPLKIGYIGYLREYEYLTKWVDIFGKDERFEFHIHGSGDCVEELREYSKDYQNVYVYGAYDEKDKMNIVDSFDIICYNYPKSFVNYPAIANKFYDGIIRKKPMFANIETFSGILVDENGLGISLKENECDITDKIYNYYKSFDESEFENNCNLFLEKVTTEDKYYMSKIEEFVRG